MSSSAPGMTDPIQAATAVTQGGLRWAVGIPRTQKVYDRDVRLIPPAGRKRRPVPDQEPQTAEAALAGQRWRRVN